MKREIELMRKPGDIGMKLGSADTRITAKKAPQIPVKLMITPVC